MTTPRALTEHLVSREQGGLPLRWRSWEQAPSWKVGYKPHEREKSSSKTLGCFTGAISRLSPSSSHLRGKSKTLQAHPGQSGTQGESKQMHGGQRPYLYDRVYGGVTAQAQLCAGDTVANGSRQDTDGDTELLVAAMCLGEHDRALESLKQVWVVSRHPSPHLPSPGGAESLRACQWERRL